jgi:hypothetical protein
MWSPNGRQMHRMLSARLAERAVAQYYRALGRHVLDVARSQLDPSAQGWKTHDLVVDGVPIDVKNATRSRYRRDRYTSHCVPRFKQARNDEHVLVAGVISEWATLDTLMDNPPHVLFLGTTDEAHVTRVLGALRHGPLQVTLSDGMSGPSFLPPWLFDLGPECYVARDAGFAVVKNWLLHSASEIPRPFPLAPLALGGIESLWPSARADLPGEQQRLGDELVQALGRRGTSLASLFLSILELFLKECLRLHRFDAGQLRPLLFASPDTARPAFLHDPLRTIDGLLITLQTVADNARTEFTQFRFFRLLELNILQAKTRDSDPWQTVIAYCGGWHEGAGPCGNAPLLIGVHKTCSCNRLICDKCGYCSDHCQSRPIMGGYQ